MPILHKHIVLVGLMGAGKTSTGRKLAELLDRPFVDSDIHVEHAAGLKTKDIFEIYGEESYRTLETKVIDRLLKSPEPAVIATGGGAYMSETTQANIATYGTSIWLSADIDRLMERIVTTEHRPMLENGDRREILKSLIQKRDHIYARADIHIDVDKSTARTMAKRIKEKLDEF